MAKIRSSSISRRDESSANKVLKVMTSVMVARLQCLR